MVVFKLLSGLVLIIALVCAEQDVTQSDLCKLCITVASNLRTNPSKNVNLDNNLFTSNFEESAKYGQDEFEDLCTDHGMCNEAESDLSDYDDLEYFQDDQDLMGSRTCNQCKNIVRRIIMKAKNTSSREAVKYSMMSKACKTGNSKSCKRFVRKNKNLLLRYILKKPKANFVCSKLGKC